MNLGPLLVRELHGEARRSSARWIRVAGAAVLALVALDTLQQPRLAPHRIGNELLGDCTRALAVLVWLGIPLLAADCISRERREGTLPLLLMTPLRSGEVVVAKALLEGVRLATVAVALVPILLLPILFGGVSVNTVVLALAYLAQSAALALALTLLASALCTRRMVAILFALSLAWLCHFGVRLVYDWVDELRIAAAGLWRSIGPIDVPVEVQLANWVRYLVGLAGFDFKLWQWVLPKGRVSGGVEWAWGLFACWVMLGIVLVWVAGRLVGVVGRNPDSSRLGRGLRALLSAPVVGSGLHARRSESRLGRNPIGWLQERSWQSRAQKWGWCLGLLLAEIVLIAGYGKWDLLEANIPLAWLTGVAIIYIASSSFATERADGSLELLLVTPLTVCQIVDGRMRGVWAQCAPSVGLLAGVIGPYIAEHPNLLVPVLPPAGCFLFAPAVGIYFSFLPRHAFVRFGLSVLILLLPSWVWLRWLVPVADQVPHLLTAVLIAVGLQASAAVICYRRLRSLLESRRFAEHRS